MKLNGWKILAASLQISKDENVIKKIKIMNSF